MRTVFVIEPDETGRPDGYGMSAGVTCEPTIKLMSVRWLQSF